MIQLPIEIYKSYLERLGELGITSHQRVHFVK